MRRELMAAAAAFLLPAAAHAGGLGRPTVISARAFGWGGAFTAVADDASALHYNPAGLALQRKSSILLGGELIIAPRTYTPEFADPAICENDPRRCEPQSPADRPNVVPTLGYTNRLSSRGVPSRLALGVGVWNTFGGELHYDKMEDRNQPVLDMVRDAVIEVVPGVAYEVNDFLAIGAAFRLGIGLFAVDATAKPADGSFSAFGVGAGGTLGIMIRPSKSLNIGLVYRTALTVSTTGSGELQLDMTPGAPATPVDVAHDQNWPQSASIGLAYRLTPRLRLATQLDWTDWSHVEKIVVRFPGRAALDQVYDEDWADNFAAHVGGELTVSRSVDVRAGYTYDSAAVPERTIERQYLDAPKHAVGLGAGFQLSRRWRVDTAFELIFGPAREVEDNRQEYQDAGWPQRANVAPGRHEGKVYTFELQAQFQY